MDITDNLAKPIRQLQRSIELSVAESRKTIIIDHLFIFYSWNNRLR